LTLVVNLGRGLALHPFYIPSGGANLAVEWRLARLNSAHIPHLNG
jgi:hypothetical protein